MAVTVLGFMAFQAAAFYLAFFMQELRSWSAIVIAVHLLPQAIAGMLWNVVIGNILHRVDNTLLMAAGALAYLAADLLLSFMRADSNYWAFIFPALVLNVVGADFQFNVANMYVMQSLPPDAQGLASGIMNTLVRLASTLSMGLATAVYATYEGRPGDAADPMLKFTRTFQVSVALAALGVLVVPFIRIGTQGGDEQQQPLRETAMAENGDGLVEMQEGAAAKKKEEMNVVEEKHDKLGGIDGKFWKKEFGGKD